MASAATSRVAGAFDLAEDYDRHARVQRRIANRLADRIAALPIVAERGKALRLLEIGCGTGFLTRALAERGVAGRWLVTDIAPAMIGRCAGAMRGCAGSAAIEYAAMDGERPPAGLPQGGFDIVCSSMTFQWFADLEGALYRLAALLTPDGALALSTLLAGTFAEWDQAHRRHDLLPAGLAYPDADALAALFPPGNLTIEEATERDAHDSAAGFLHALKRIGAGTPGNARRPLSPAALRSVMTTFDAMGAAVTYRVALCRWERR